MRFLAFEKWIGAYFGRINYLLVFRSILLDLVCIVAFNMSIFRRDLFYSVVTSCAYCIVMCNSLQLLMFVLAIVYVMLTTYMNAVVFTTNI